MIRSFTFKTLEIDVGFNYYPGEPEIRYYSDGSGYPGLPAYIEIVDIYHQTVNIFEFFEETNLLSQLEVYMMENLDVLI